MIRRLLLLLLLASPCLAQTNYNLYLHQNGLWELIPCLNCEFGTGTGAKYFAGHGLTLSGTTFAIDPTVVLLNGNPQVNGQSIFNGGNILISTGLVYSAGNGILQTISSFSADPAVVVTNGGFTINVVGGTTNTVKNGGNITITPGSGGGNGFVANTTTVNASISSTSGSFVLITGMTHTLVTTGNSGKILVCFSGTFFHNALVPDASFQLTVDGSQVEAIRTAYNQNGDSDTAEAPINFHGTATGLSAGSHTIAANWQNNSSTGTMIFDPQNDSTEPTVLTSVQVQ